ncbi:sensor histidine kinase [Pelagibacterium montanilacus]|uniref:sensor histidine kinase n=1 Tax=Pelagibacterium montanilacus TaxID=2185280 RepID=UPI0013E053DB|nr:HWE histidine kinase domain-containing protein [Pelagibacterium montanilacus]
MDADTLNKGLLAGKVGVWRWRVDTDQLEWSENLESLHGLEAGTFDGTLSSFRNDIHPSDTSDVWQAIQSTLETGDPYTSVYRTNPSLSTDPVWIEASGSIVTDPEGVRYLTGVCMDVTARRAAERELETRLAQQKAIADFGTFAFGEGRIQKVLDRAVDVAADVLDVPLTKILLFAGTADHLRLASGRGWHDGLVGNATVGTELQSQAGYTLVAKSPVIVEDLRTETRFSGPELLHEHGVRSGISVLIPGSSTRPFGVFGIHDTRLRQFADTDAEFLLSLATIVANAARNREALDHRQLLVREMSHRAGNMLQLVSTIASQTFSSARSPEEAHSSFSERLGSLSRANYIVAHGGWTSTRVRTLFGDTLKPFADRISMQGRDVLLPPDLCFDLGLIAHELAANSSRYGSLAGDDGRVELNWNVERSGSELATFTLTWRDPINTEPDPSIPRRGFGSRLMVALIESKWSGKIDVERAQGYCLSASIPFTPA